MKRKKKHFIVGVTQASPGRWKPDDMRNAWMRILIWAAEGMRKEHCLSIRDVRHTLIVGDMKVSRKCTKSDS